MYLKYFFVSLFAIVLSVFTLPSFSDHNFFFKINTLRSYTGEQLVLKSDWTLHNDFTGSIGPGGFHLLMTPDESIAIPAADVTIATPDGSATCLLHIKIGGEEVGGPIDQVDVDATCSPRIVYNIPDINNCSDSWPLLACYTINFTLLPAQKK